MVFKNGVLSPKPYYAHRRVFKIFAVERDEWDTARQNYQQVAAVFPFSNDESGYILPSPVQRTHSCSMHLRIVDFGQGSTQNNGQVLDWTRRIGFQADLHNKNPARVG